MQLEGRHLAYLLNTSFWASLRHEEGPPARGALTIADRTVPGGLRFREPVILTQESIVQLTPALGHALAAVELSPDGMPQVWGVLEAAPPWQPVIRIAGPAHIVVSQDKDVLGLIRGGETHLVRGGPHSLMDVIGGTLDHGDSAPSPDRMAKVEHLLKVVATMHRHGKGGTIVVVPTAVGEWPDSVRMRYPLDERSSGISRSRLVDQDDISPERPEGRGRTSAPDVPGLLLPRTSRSQSLLADLSQRLLVQMGQLSAAEGAVVIGDDLTLFGFGAALEPPEAEVTLSVVNAVTGQVEHDRTALSVGNGRHALAARFVYHHPQCLAFVATPDGSMTLFAWAAQGRPITALTHLQDLLAEY
ncbi:MAG TPA: hypothetical protein VH879_06130 [Gemmatimonadales bacterium]